MDCTRRVDVVHGLHLILSTDSHEETIVRMDCAGGADVVQEVHTNDEIQPRIARGGYILFRFHQHV